MRRGLYEHIAKVESEHCVIHLVCAEQRPQRLICMAFGRLRPFERWSVLLELPEEKATALCE